MTSEYLIAIAAILAIAALIQIPLALWAIRKVLMEGINEILRALESIDRKLGSKDG